MSANECRCGKPTRDAAYVCDQCADGLALALGEIPWLDDELETTMTKQRGLPTEGGRPDADCSCTAADIDNDICKHGSLPWHEKAADTRRALHGLLATWSRFCDEEHVRHSSPRMGLPADTTVAMSRWLLWRVDGLALHDIGPEAVDEITNAVAEGHRIIDRRPDRWYAGPCVGEECTADLYASKRSGNVSCKVCGSTYDVAERRAWLLTEAEDRLAPAVEIARAVSWLGAEPLTAARVRKWAERDRIETRGHDADGRPLYRIGDAIDLLASDTRKAVS